MKNIKYQVVKLAQLPTLAPFYKELQIQLDPNYDICSGIVLVEHPLEYSGGGTIYDINPQGYSDNIKFGFDNSAGVIYSPIPVKLLSLTLENSKEYLKDSFKPLFARASGENINIVFTGDKATSLYNYDLIFRLEKNSKVKENNIDYQHIRFTVPAGVSLYETGEYILNSRFRKVKGIWMNSDYDFQARIGIKTTSGEYLLEPLIHKLLRKSVSVPYSDRFFPLDFVAGGNIVNFEVDMIHPIIQTDVDIVFELEK